MIVTIDEIVNNEAPITSSVIEIEEVITNTLLEIDEIINETVITVEETIIQNTIQIEEERIVFAGNVSTFIQKVQPPLDRNFFWIELDDNGNPASMWVNTI